MDPRLQEIREQTAATAVNDPLPGGGYVMAECPACHRVRLVLGVCDECKAAETADLNHEDA